MKILDRYVFAEVFFTFLFGVMVFTILFISADLLFRMAKMMVEGGASFKVALSFLLNSLPQILVFTFPMSMLLACLLGFGRLSGESELVAMKASGISFPRIIVSAVVFSLLIAFLSFAVNNYIAPITTFNAQNILINYLMRSDTQIKENMVLRDRSADGSDRLLYIRRIDNREGTMQGVFIHYFVNGKRTREIFAEEAVWEGNTWYLTQPRTIEFAPDESIKYESVSERAELPLLGSPQELMKRQKNKEEMNLGELRAKLKQYSQMKENVNKKDYNELAVYYQQRYALPFTCFVFSLFGIPLGVRPQRTSKSIGLGLSLVFIFIFYLFMTIGTTVGVQGSLPPLVAAWLANLVFGGVGIYMIVEASKK